MKKIIFLLAILVLDGCRPIQSYNIPFISQKEAAYVENDNVSVQLAIAAQKASNAIIELAEIEKVRTPATVAPIIEDVPRLLRQPMTITWNGPVAPLAEKIADRAMYGFHELGNKPLIPIFVQIEAVETPLVDILKNMSLQSGARANIKIDVENRNIEVHYVEVKEVI